MPHFRLAVAGAVGTAIVVVWELALVHSPPEESARLAIYWVDDRWRWPLLLIAGTVGLSGLAWLARRGSIVPAFWLAGCLALGLLGVVGLPIPVWYRFLLLCQIPLAIGVAVVLAHVGSTRTLAIVLATFALAIGVKVATLLEAPPSVSYFGSELQAVWKLGEHVPPGPGLVATDPKTSYFIPAATGHRVLTLDKAHASSRRELAFAADGYRLLRRYYAGGRTWWQAGQEMWRRGVRYVIVEKHTTLQPAELEDFTWQSSILRTDAQRRALSRYFYENNRDRRSRLRLARLRRVQAGSTEASRARCVRHTSESWAVSATAARSRPATSDMSGLLIAGVRNPRSYGVARYTARLADALAEEQIVYRLERATDPCRQDALPPGELLARTFSADARRACPHSS